MSKEHASRLLRFHDALQLNDAHNEAAHRKTRALVVETIIHEGIKTRDQANIHGQAVATAVLASERRRRRSAVLDSLFWHEYRVGKDEVVPAHRETFSWIFQESNSTSRCRSDSFANWFLHGSDLFWIHGKPGSGKSTMCNYIVDNIPATRIAGEWASGRQFCCASFFFSISAVRIERSTAGLLRSLLYQLATQSDLVLDKVYERSNAGSLHIPSWTTSALLNTLSTVLAAGIISAFVLIDGIDDCADARAVLDVYERLRRLPNVRLCVSGRAKQPFQRAFTDCASLSLHDLNHEDINCYAKSIFSGFPTLLEFADTIARRANGAFLWAKLVCQTIEDAHSDGDSREMLRQRFSQCPQALDELYAHLSQSIDELRRQEALLYMVIARQIDTRWCSPLGVSDFEFLLTVKICKPNILPTAIDRDPLAPITADDCDILSRRVTSCTNGLIERRRSRTWIDQAHTHQW